MKTSGGADPRIRAGRSRPASLRLATVGLVVLFLASCASNSGLPEPGSEKYRELVHAFYVGLAGLQSGADVRAKKDLTLATQIAPGEPASWANLGILAIRQ